MPITTLIQNDGTPKKVKDTSELEGPALISIRLLNDNVNFVIPEYQRGFRWTRQQIKELIDDLYEFSKDRDSVMYCLQNITIRRTDEDSNKYVYEVIDGQQRLTAIWILIMAYMNSRKYDKTEELPMYSLSYEGKEDFTKYVADLSEYVKNNPADERILEIEYKKGDIDSAFLHDALSYLINDYRNGNNNYNVVLSKIFCDEFYNDEKEVRLIWNEIKPVGSDDVEKLNYTITRFSNINANKIPLTESELIKAYFIEKLKEEKVNEFSLLWEEMERGLNNDDFWWFLTSGNEVETRMDLLFQVYLNENEVLDRNGKHILSRSINEKLINSETTYEIWKNIVKLYNTLNDWYNDYYYYHVIGLIIAIENQQSNLIIKKLYNDYQGTNKDKFKEMLKKQIRKEECFKIPFKSNANDWNIKAPCEIVLDGSDKDEISYVRNKNLVKPILLLFNIALLLNAYNINPENAAERFSFKIYKNKENPVEIEHINPQHLEGKNFEGKEYTAPMKKEWALKTLEIIDDENVREELKIEVENADWSRTRKSLVEKIEIAAQLNTLSNLTLIDKELNGSYGDKFFNDKRRHVLAARFGNSVQGDENRRYTQSVIFPGTMWVFMRQYNSTYEENDDGEKTKRDVDRWEAEARSEYIKCMQDSFFRFLNFSEDGETEKREEEVQ